MGGTGESHSLSCSSGSVTSSLSSTVASQVPRALNATFTRSDCFRPAWWMYCRCTMSSCKARPQLHFRQSSKRSHS
ncbi:hypothetical protein Nmel_009982 [Mimus melanotis]